MPKSYKRPIIGRCCKEVYPPGVWKDKNFIFVLVYKIGLMRDNKIIVVEDNEAVLKILKTILSREFKTVIGTSVPTLLPVLLREEDVDVVLLDMNFGTGRQTGGEGLFWLDHILNRQNPPAVVLITAFGDIELAVSSLKKGAADFIVKPWDNEKLIGILLAATERRSESRSDSVVGLLVNSLLKKYAVAYSKPLLRVTPEALLKLSVMTSRGDLAALQQTIERAVLLANGSLLDAADFFTENLPSSSSHPVTLDEMEKQFITEVLNEKKGNLTLTAQQLNISRQTLYNKMRKYGM